MSKAYHYCSVETFLSIIKNRSFYLSDPLKMNDRTELIHFLQNIDPEYWNKMNIRAGTDFTTAEVEEYINLYGNNSIFVGSFSDKKDSLSQWICYGDDGQGVSIEFDLSKVSNGETIFESKVEYPEGGILSSKYPVEEMCLLDEIEQIIEDEGLVERDDQLKVFLSILLRILVQYKNNSFVSESEIRIIYDADQLYYKHLKDCDVLDTPLPVPLKRNFRYSNGQIIEYAELDISGAICKVYLGPKNNMGVKDTERIVEDIYGVHISVEKSDAPYK